MNIEKIVAAFKEQNAEAYESIKGEGFKAGQVKGHDEGVASERERVKLLADCVTFKANTAFVLEQIAKGHELSKAKAEYADLLAAENDRLRQQAAEALDRAKLADAAHPATNGAPNPLPTQLANPTGASATEAKRKFEARVDELTNSKKISRQSAVNMVYSQEPELYQAYVDAVNAENAAKAKPRR